MAEAAGNLVESLGDDRADLVDLVRCHLEFPHGVQERFQVGVVVLGITNSFGDGVCNMHATRDDIVDTFGRVVVRDPDDELVGQPPRLCNQSAELGMVDAEHLDHYGTFDRVREAFRQFVENVPFYGFGVMCTDHPEVQALVGRIEDRRIITYGENAQADVRFENHRMDGAASLFDVTIRSRKTGMQTSITGLRLPMPGRHNVSNATAAIAVASELGIGADAIIKGLAGFGGVKRRFTHTGSWNGVEIFDDYGHHPVEIKAVLRAARDASKGRVIAIAQPHRFTRLRDLFDEFSACFNDADTVMVAPVYAAGEDAIDGVTSDALVSRIRAGGHRDARFIDGPADIAPAIRALAKSGDFVVFLGAGNITQWAYALPKELAGSSDTVAA